MRYLILALLLVVGCSEKPRVVSSPNTTYVIEAKVVDESYYIENDKVVVEIKLVFQPTTIPTTQTTHPLPTTLYDKLNSATQPTSKPTAPSTRPAIQPTTQKHEGVFEAYLFMGITIIIMLVAVLLRRPKKYIQ